MHKHFSSTGTKFLVVYAITYVFNILCLAFSVRVNMFTEFFYIADLFPLGMSIVTLVLMSFGLLLDIAMSNSPTGRAPFKIASSGLLSIFWLAFNAFSTSRWRHVPMQCGVIPTEFAEERTWCHDIQALKAFVWIEWLMMFGTCLFTLRFALSQSSAGFKHVWSTSLARYSPRTASNGTAYNSEDAQYVSRASEFVQYNEKR